MHLWDYLCLRAQPGAYDVPQAGAEPGLWKAHAEPEPPAQALLLRATEERETTAGTGGWNHSVCVQGSALGLL